MCFRIQSQPDIVAIGSETKIIFVKLTFCRRDGSQSHKRQDIILGYVRRHDVHHSFSVTYKANQWSSLEEGDEQLELPNSQTIMEICHACVA